ncbi:tetratricopeptide repeat protein [Thiovibrio frasassiensis]|uniref:Tetratricopeptide repeat protein n=1 Tax=Thiovibrio frasassiensis TaxID=2984131 RepID=A0A9X4RLH4_9BACT|nr:tetratricopeptide repeat protein [Thiovibrio frasassiensis]MDG4476121.1 tetratricopeptide repeat protein [Thiovibrio frasassiensis]
MRIRLPIYPPSFLPFLVACRARAFAIVGVSFLCLFGQILLPASGSAAELAAPQGKEIVPARTIQLKEDKDVAWKSLWDQGRELARNGRLAEAVPVYEALLGMREGLEAARWELVTILLQLKREEGALSHLESLIEVAPGNLQYLLALAEASKGQGNAARAGELYKKVLQREPANLRALRGAASALLVQQKKSEAATMLEALLRREPARVGLREELANLYYDMGAYDKARKHFTVLAGNNQSDPGILLKTAQSYDKSGLENQAVEYWQRLARISQTPEAKERLTAYYLKGGKGEDALAYLLPLLEKEPASPRLLKRLGQIYAALSRLPEALAYFERYISLKPEDKEVLRQVIDIHAGLGNKPEKMVLGRGLSLEPAPDLENLERGAGLYETAGEFREAVALYDQILAVTPDDPKILAKRAKALMASGNEDEANSMWTHLARREKLLEVLEVLFKMEPANTTVLKKLASMYLDRGELSKSLEMFSRLDALGVRTPEVLAGQALVCERLGRLAQALVLYEQLLAGADATGMFRLRCVQLAGELGLLRKTQSHLVRLQEKFPELYASPQTQLLVAQALVQTASYAAAREYYSAILGKYQGDGELVRAALLGLAEAYRQSGLLYEAEQALRQAYLRFPQDEVILGRLFALALQEKRFAAAWAWLGQLDAAGKRQEAKESIDNRLLRARLVAAEGETGSALKLLGQLTSELPSKAGSGGLSSLVLLRRDIDLLRVRLLFAEGRYAEAEQLAVTLSGQRGKPEADLLLLRVYRAQGKSREEQVLFQRMQGEFAQDQGLVLDLLKGLQEEGLVAELCARGELASREYPDSVAIRSLVASGREVNGEIGVAIALWRGIVLDFPEQEFAAVRLAQLLFSHGRFVEARAEADRFPERGLRPDVLLLKARIFWAEHDWEKAVAVYDTFLQPSVAERVIARGRELGVVLPQGEKPGLWTQLTVPEIDRQTVIDALMEPSALLDSGSGATALNQVAVPFYAQYRWQKQFALEKTARQAVMHREYLAAANYFRSLLREYPAVASLQFDLAGIYSRFGQLGHEAALYEEINSTGGDFPGLAEARERNELKRRPRVALGYGYLREEGREGYKAIKKSWEEISLQYSPHLQHDLVVNLARLDYQDPGSNGKIRGNRALVTYAANINEQLLLRGGGGAEVLENGQPDTALVQLAAEGRFGDRLTGILSYGRDVKHDTLASLERKIVQQDYKADFVLDMVRSVQAGGGYLYSMYSDDNTMKGYDLWAAYLLFFDPAFLKFSYTYDFKDTIEGRGDGVLLADGFAASDHPYWTPMNYWQNRFSVYFKHQLSDDQFRRGVPRYYDLEYVVVYDEMGYAMQTWKGGFFVECAPQIILSATTELTSGPEYRAKEFFLSAVYRW